MRQRETRVSGFLTPLSVLFSTAESRVGPGPRMEPQDAGLTAAQVGMRARSATAFWKDQIVADISCYHAGVQQHHGAS